RQGKRLCVSQCQAERQEAAVRVHHGAEILAPCSHHRGRDFRGLEGTLRLSQFSPFTGDGTGEAESGPENRTRRAAPRGLRHDHETLCAVRHGLHAGCARQVPGTAHGGQNSLAHRASSVRIMGSIVGWKSPLFATKFFEMWWPGTELNRRRQPFQGCALPPELPGHFRTSRFTKLLADRFGRNHALHWAGCRKAKQPMRSEHAEPSHYNNVALFIQNGGTERDDPDTGSDNARAARADRQATGRRGFVYNRGYICGGKTCLSLNFSYPNLTRKSKRLALLWSAFPKTRWTSRRIPNRCRSANSHLTWRSWPALVSRSLPHLSSISQ